MISTEKQWGFEGGLRSQAISGVLITSRWVNAALPQPAPDRGQEKK